MAKKITKEAIKQQFIETLQSNFNISPDEASDKQVYQTLSTIVVNILKEKRQHFITNAHSLGKKQRTAFPGMNIITIFSQMNHMEFVARL